MEKNRIMNPTEIEKKSFEIIENHIIGIDIKPENKDVLKRVIHTTADFDYVENLKFSENAVENAVKALKKGADIVTDTTMALSGINKRILKALGGEVRCFISDEDVAFEAKKRGVTRSAVAMEKASKIDKPLIFAIGNAPTALIKLDELIKENKIFPVLVIGVPVGFVNVCESKEMIMENNIEYIVARGNKGGSNVAAAICNALIYKILR
jgi:precorrin-8X/cobalt-precorrin-8 methylmutase